MGNRTVVLADLDTSKRSANSCGGGDVSSLGQRIGDPICAFRNRIVIVIIDGRNAGQNGVDPAAGEYAHGVVAADLS